MNLSFTKIITSSDKILIDTNVLIFIYCPLNNEENDELVSYYSDILEKIYKSKAKVYTNSLIISEFINTWLRIDCKKQGFENFKRDYRCSTRYKTVIKQILKQLNKFYTRFNVYQLDDSFNKFDYKEIYLKFPEIDFNDLIIAKNALQNDCKVLTNDNDFGKFGIERI